MMGRPFVRFSGKASGKRGTPDGNKPENRRAIRQKSEKKNNEPQNALHLHRGVIEKGKMPEWIEWTGLELANGS
ncbi:hypothetical protein ACMY0K_13080, partial [Bacteroides sp. KG121]|uniref:hypothetical protein n=1 Tax=Bacteroides sp. KG121 TaxID=3397826 RepID=UPI003D979E35